MDKNKTVMFKPLPEPVDQEILFPLNETQLRKWLYELPGSDSYLFCKAVFSFLQNFNTLELNPNQKSALMLIVLNQIPVHTEQLENTFIDSSFPLSKQENRHAEIIVWLYFELARGFSQAMDKTEGFGKKRQAASLMYQSFYCLSQAFLYMQEVYADPFPGFWQLCYQLYQKAEQAKLLSIEVNKKNTSIHSVQHYFNLIIVFELTGTNQFRSRHIKRIYDYLSGFIEHAKVTKKIEDKYLKSYCMIDLSSDSGPIRMTKSLEHTETSFRYITPVIIAKKMYRDLRSKRQSDDPKNSIQQKIFLKAINNLGMAQFRKNSRIKKELACTGVIGLNNIISLLKQEGNFDESLKNHQDAEQQPEQHPPKPDTRVAGQWEVPDLELVPFGEETAHQLRETYKTKMWHNKKLDRLFSAYQEDASMQPLTQPSEVPDLEDDEVSIKGFEILDSSPQGHRVLCKSEDVKVKTGDVLGIVPDFTGRIEVGLVCRLNNSYYDGVSLGVKVLSLETKLVKISRRIENHTPILALYLPGTISINKTNCIIFNSSHYKSGDKISIQLEGKTFSAELGKLLNFTSSISHIELKNIEQEA